MPVIDIIVFSTVTYVIQELVAVNLKYRGKILWNSMLQLLEGLGEEGRKNINNKIKSTISQNQQSVASSPIIESITTKQFFEHPQIKTLCENLQTPPSYIPASNFALAIMDIVSEKIPATVQNDLFTRIQQGLKIFSTSNGDIIKVLQNLVDTSMDIKELQKKIEDWYDSYME